jgi:hypothetical protein
MEKERQTFDVPSFGKFSGKERLLKSVVLSCSLSCNEGASLPRSDDIFFILSKQTFLDIHNTHYQ